MSAHDGLAGLAEYLRNLDVANVACAETLHEWARAVDRVRPGETQGDREALARALAGDFTETLHAGIRWEERDVHDRAHWYRRADRTLDLLQQHRRWIAQAGDEPTAPLGFVLVDVETGQVTAGDGVDPSVESWIEAVGGECCSGTVRLPIERVVWSGDGEDATPVVHVGLPPVGAQALEYEEAVTVLVVALRGDVFARGAVDHIAFSAVLGLQRQGYRIARLQPVGDGAESQSPQASPKDGAS